ncbi:hypothetical protein CIG75_00695 [Tumebacillus algifaecis]|uniref:Endonuclease NucS C-terminal domain-containing protein n=1 Tax=Tumebacillus algifaecis TaxID=1214604 RepID=A0A223CWG3_9BACL|nr:endonuclease NucS domain-containing protein [Tumebacillus algifaecis]ASS73640.1 hypothetical protein CIG75_00695 [Tumebacillus algifaecis]
MARKQPTKKHLDEIQKIVLSSQNSISRRTLFKRFAQLCSIQTGNSAAFIDGLTVNHPHRTNAKFNNEDRICNKRFDLLYDNGDQMLSLYDQKIHGHWRIEKVGNNSYRPTKVTVEKPDILLTFQLESHLRDAIASTISEMEILKGHYLSLFQDSTGKLGIEYSIPTGIIDLLCVDQFGDFVVIELKNNKTTDQVLGQIARYIGWVKQHLAQGKAVHGLIITPQCSEQLRYAASIVPNLYLLEYSIQFHEVVWS